MAILFLMYREHLIPFCHSGTPPLLDKDELAMDNQQGAEGPEVEQHEAGGNDMEEVLYIQDSYFWILTILFFGFSVDLDQQKNYKITINAILCATICYP